MGKVTALPRGHKNVNNSTRKKFKTTSGVNPKSPTIRHWPSPHAASGKIENTENMTQITRSSGDERNVIETHEQWSTEVVSYTTYKKGYTIPYPPPPPPPPPLLSPGLVMGSLSAFFHWICRVPRPWLWSRKKIGTASPQSTTPPSEVTTRWVPADIAARWTDVTTQHKLTRTWG